MAERQPDPPVAVIIPPRANAVPSPTADTTPSQRDQHIRMIRDRGRLGWQKAVGYGRRSLGETAMFRYKTIIGRGLRARTLPAQKTEARVACSVLNRMTQGPRIRDQRLSVTQDPQLQGFTNAERSSHFQPEAHRCQAGLATKAISCVNPAG